MTSDKPIYHAESQINQAIAATLVECGYWFFTDSRQSAGSKEEDDLLRFWRLRFSFEKSGEKLNVPILLFLGHANIIRFWSTLNASNKIEDAEKIKVYQTIRSGSHSARASFSDESPNQIVIEIDQYVDSSSSVTRGLIENAVGNLYRAATRLITEFGYVPIEIGYQ